ncbi:hypothetical protein FB2170_04905 [Maribacter sp. HTCC2170]|nr:hypothetical protein FB2170_04905 [Maribacter sp. HTCC2170]
MLSIGAIIYLTQLHFNSWNIFWQSTEKELLTTVWGKKIFDDFTCSLH